MAGVFTNDAHGPFAADDLALVTNLFDARANFHFRLWLFLVSGSAEFFSELGFLFVAVGDAATARIVRADFYGDAVTRQNTNVKLAHSSADRCEHDEPVVAFDSEHRIRKCLLDDTVEFELVALRLFSFSPLAHSHVLSVDPDFWPDFWAPTPTAASIIAVTSSTEPTPLTRFKFPRFS